MYCEYVYICIYICIYMYMYVYVYICIYIYILDSTLRMPSADDVTYVYDDVTHVYDDVTYVQLDSTLRMPSAFSVSSGTGLFCLEYRSLLPRIQVSFASNTGLFCLEYRSLCPYSSTLRRTKTTREGAYTWMEWGRPSAPMSPVKKTLCLSLRS